MTETTKVDAGALLFAVITVAIGPLTSPGEWTSLTSVISAVVLVVVVAFLDMRSAGSQTGLQRLASAMVIGLIVAVGLAWPIQEVFIRRHHYADANDLGARTTNWLWVPLVAATLLTYVVRRGRPLGKHAKTSATTD